jgi:ribonuclease HII
MARVGRSFPGYGFERHMGYATEAHLAALGAHGPCPHHRQSFAPVKALIGGAPIVEIAVEETLLIEA